MIDSGATKCAKSYSWQMLAALSLKSTLVFAQAIEFTVDQNSRRI